MSSERLEQSLAMSGPTAQLHSGIAQAKEFEDPPGKGPFFLKGRFFSKKYSVLFSTSNFTLKFLKYVI